MRKPTLKRLALGLVQQTAALLLMVAIAAILFNSYLAVDTADGAKVYELSPLDAETEFEDSVIFHDLFQSSVSDIIQLMVIKGQMETNGSFDPYKYIGITEFVSGKTGSADCPVTAVYELEDLIKWGKYGVEYTDRIMSMSDFVNYFGSVNQNSNFRLDADGQLVFSVEGTQTEEQQQAVTQAIEAIPESQRTERLEDLAFTYIVKESVTDIRVSREDDGTLTVYFPMLVCRYATVDGEKQLTACANNWVEYTALQNNLALAIHTLSANYEQYQNCNDLYQENASNLKYAVRLMSKDGITRTYTNVSEIADSSDNEMTDYFSEYRRYLIYYPDSLEFTGNTGMTERQIYQYLKDYDYAHPDMTHIWIAVDTNYPVQGDAFYNANVVFQRIVPNIWYLIGGGILLVVLWLLIGIYLTVTAGVAFDEEDEPVLYLNGIDHVWIECMALALLACVYAGKVGYGYLMDTANKVYLSHSEIQGREITRLAAYGVFAVYGFSVSAGINVFWYSLIRRIKSHNMWSDSFLHWLVSSFGKAVHFVSSHRNSAVSSLIPYNLFLLANLAGILAAYLLRGKGVWWLLPTFAAVILDGIVGVLKFKQKAEQIDYVRRIYKDFEEAGYYCQHFLLDASKMGVPQKRERVFFICIRHDLGVHFLKVSDLFNVEPYIDMEFNESEIYYGEYADYKGKPIGVKMRKLFEQRVAGDIALAEAYKKQTGKRGFFNQQYLYENKVSYTLTTHADSIIPFKQPIYLSRSEVCNISTFPQDYHFLNQSPHYICGMSVPPVMMAHVASRIWKYWLSKL